MSETLPTLEVDVISDVVCPWCYVGKKHLEKAIEKVKGRINIKVEWHPFQLNPAMPVEGRDWKEYMEERFGGLDRLAQAHERLRFAGKSAGITFGFDRVTRAANTLLAHRLIWIAGNEGGPNLQDQVVEELFKAFHVEGRDVGNKDTLLKIASTAGMDPGQVAEQFAADVGLAEVQAAEAQGRKLGVSGVPFFIAAKKLAVSGAQPVETLVGMMERALGEGQGE